MSHYRYGARESHGRRPTMRRDARGVVHVERGATGRSHCGVLMGELRSVGWDGLPCAHCFGADKPRRRGKR